MYKFSCNLFYYIWKYCQTKLKISTHKAEIFELSLKPREVKFLTSICEAPCALWTNNYKYSCSRFMKYSQYLCKQIVSPNSNRNFGIRTCTAFFFFPDWLLYQNFLCWQSPYWKQFLYLSLPMVSWVAAGHCAGWWLNIFSPGQWEIF